MRRQFGTDRHRLHVHRCRSHADSFARLSQAGDEAVDARVFGGMHFRTGCVLGLRQGEKVGRYVFDRSLRPHGKKVAHDK